MVPPRYPHIWPGPCGFAPGMLQPDALPAHAAYRPGVAAALHTAAYWAHRGKRDVGGRLFAAAESGQQRADDYRSSRWSSPRSARRSAATSGPRRSLADGTTWMSGSRWCGRSVLRVSVSHRWTTDEDVQHRGGRRRTRPVRAGAAQAAERGRVVLEHVGAPALDALVPWVRAELVEEDQRPDCARVLRGVRRPGPHRPALRALCGEDRCDRVGGQRRMPGCRHVRVVDGPVEQSLQGHRTYRRGLRFQQPRQWIRVQAIGPRHAASMHPRLVVGVPGRTLHVSQEVM